jgi:hypothetical protein
MSGSIRWLVGFIMLFGLVSILGNMIDNRTELLSVSQIQTMSPFQNVTTTQIVGTSGNKGAIGNLLPSTIEEWIRALSWDFSFWYEYDHAGVKTGDSPLILVRYILFFPLSVGLLVLFFLTLRQLLFGQ